MAIDTAKMARQSVATSSTPPSTFLTSGGNRTIATPPTAQNQQVTIAPHQIRASSRNCFTRSTVEIRIFGRMTRLGAASPVGGMNRLESQHDSENAMISNMKKVGSLLSLTASPPTIVPSRIAMKVAPSTSALPAGSSDRSRWSGRMPYLIGPNSAAITPNRNSATKSVITASVSCPIVCSQKPKTARNATPISTNFSR